MLTVENLQVSYGSIRALHGISLSVPQGSIVTLIGGAALARIDHPLGQVVLLISVPLGLYWWSLYRQLNE
jgi:ABC-type arginine transport system ATPase subunit